MSSTPVEISPEISRFDAENATALTTDFLKRLGYKGSWLPMKVSLDGELYVVEMMLQKLTAKVQINSKTKEIKEYEFQKGESESGGPLKSKKLLLVVAIVPIAAVLMKFLGVF
jgi:aldehyde:ferredoxin oxidoreductase